MNSSSFDLPTPSTSSATVGASRSSDASTISQMIFLAVGLISFGLLWAAPVVLLTWVFGMFFGSVGIAELLERTRGLAPTTYGGAFWLAVTITVVMGVVEIRAMLSKAKDRRSFFLRVITRPSTAYWVLFVPTVLLVRIDIKGTDVPDILTTTLLLCCLGYVWFILPLALAAVSWRTTRWMWRKGAGSSFLAGALGMLGLAFASCTPLVCVVDDDEEGPSWAAAERVGKAFDRGLDQASGRDAVDGSRALMGALAEVIENPKALAPSAEVERDDRAFPPAPGKTGSKQTNAALFDQCIKDLFRGGGSSIRERKLSAFVGRHYLDRATAEEMIQDATIEICLLHARVGREPYEDLSRAFNKQADRRRMKWYRRQGTRNRCAVAVSGLYYVPQDLPDVESAAFERAFCSLDETERLILELSAQGHDASTIGAPLGLTDEAVRQRKARAIRKIRRLLQLH